MECDTVLAYSTVITSYGLYDLVVCVGVYLDMSLFTFFAESQSKVIVI